ncbi:hypothetical protein TorRG33x02_267530 [Trema orientale]|uniref:Uncharacterized protein n=1 Tax=Trema orientale TaxID=63057 RepID=A0A2P5D031_TREOI|nr:hypothetical protein TorRG33x02_267530 [Trema orientale]
MQGGSPDVVIKLSSSSSDPFFRHLLKGAKSEGKDLKNQLAWEKVELSQLQKDYKEVPYPGTEEFTNFVDDFKEDGAGALMYTLWYHHKKFDFTIFSKEAMKLASTFINSDDKEVTEQVGEEITQDRAKAEPSRD